MKICILFFEGGVVKIVPAQNNSMTQQAPTKNNTRLQVLKHTLPRNLDKKPSRGLEWIVLAQTVAC